MYRIVKGLCVSLSVILAGLSAASVFGEDDNPFTKTPNDEKENPFTSREGAVKSALEKQVNQGNAQVISEDTTFHDDQVIAKDTKYVIKPGVTVQFGARAGIKCFGVLEAVGTREKPITFTAVDEEKGWGNISLLGTNANESKFIWCRFSHGRGRNIQFNASGGLQKFAKHDEKGALTWFCGGALFIQALTDVRIESCRFESNNAFRGGAVALFGGTRATIANNVFFGNTASGSGGALQCATSRPTVSGNYFTGNRSQIGGAVSCMSRSKPTFEGNYFTGNEASKTGGAFSCHHLCEVKIKGNYIAENSTSGVGGGIVVFKNTRVILEANYIGENKDKDRTGKSVYVNSVKEGEKKDTSTCEEKDPAEKKSILDQLKTRGVTDLPNTVK